jgi:protein-L-isoaspartate(D-aspartate) O-methyltransferase
LCAERMPSRCWPRLESKISVWKMRLRLCRGNITSVPGHGRFCEAAATFVHRMMTPRGLLPEQGLNNGLPSFHATLVASAAIREGDHVVHIGAGTGYYTAIMAHLAGRSGRVTAIEYDPTLAERAAANLASLANVRVAMGDGAQVPFDVADVIYVNAGATRPADMWLDGLAEGGRLMLPLTAKKRLPPSGMIAIQRHGAVFRIERHGDDYAARWISAVGVYPCEGGRDDISEAALDAALSKGGWERVTRLYRTADLPEDRCWLRAPGWCLAYH